MWSVYLWSMYMWSMYMLSMYIWSMYRGSRIEDRITHPKVPQHSTQGSSTLNPRLHGTLHSSMRQVFFKPPTHRGKAKVLDPNPNPRKAGVLDLQPLPWGTFVCATLQQQKSMKLSK